MIHPQHLRRMIQETLAAMGERYASPSAVELLLLTAAHESKLGSYLWQSWGGEPKGPAIGIYQMEPGRYADTRDRMPMHLRGSIETVGERCFEAMAWDLRYATAMARAAYWLIPKPLPSWGDVPGLADYWHRHWCRGCKGTPEQAGWAYRFLVLREGQP